MARWRGKNSDELEKVGKMRRKGKRPPGPTQPVLDFELAESEWELGGEAGAFAARVVEVHKRYAFVSSEENLGEIKTNDVWLAEVARRYLQADRAERNFVAVGDRVLCVPAAKQPVTKAADLPRCVIQQLVPRKTKIARLDPHAPGREHVLATNMEQIMVVASYLHPTVKWGLIDRYLVMAESEGIGAIIVLNKRDLLAAEGTDVSRRECLEMEDIYRGLGYKVHSIQANAADGVSSEEIQAIRRELDGRITLLSGHSGVGKSSLVNLFDPEIVQMVEPDEDIFYKGRHTTTYASFIKLGAGGYVIDTPGIRSFTFEEKGAIELSHCFVEFRPMLGQCKFRECRHMDEPDCRVRAAVETGQVSRWRYKSYLGILLGATGREGRIRDLPIEE